MLYGTLAEIFGRATGFNKGMGGSMHAFFPPFGVMPNNAIVGGSGDIAVGAALFKRINRKPGIVIANIGDASMGCGPVWEGMMLAAMDQYRTLWPEEIGGAPPMLFNFMNNFYGMGGQPVGETMGFGVLARVGLGVNPEAMHAERVDGYNPLAVADAIERKQQDPGRGPRPGAARHHHLSLLRPLALRRHGLSHQGRAGPLARAGLDHRLSVSICWPTTVADDGQAGRRSRRDRGDGCSRVLDAAISPGHLALGSTASRDDIGEMMFSNTPEERMAEGEPEVLMPPEESRLSATLAKNRFGLDESGKPLPKLRCLTYAEALFEAMIHRFYEDPTMVAYRRGEPGLGRRVRRLSRADRDVCPTIVSSTRRSPRAPSWARRGLRHQRRPGRGRADVL